MDNNNINPLEFCSNGCGFYGNSTFNNMCSKCFKESQRSAILEEKAALAISGDTSVKSDDKTSPLKPVSPIPTETKSESVVIDTPIQLPTQEDTLAPSVKRQPHPGRCFSCRAKVPLAKQTINKCRCSFVFCDTHRYPETHSCDVNLAQHDKDILSKNNPKLHERPRLGRSFARVD